MRSTWNLAVYSCYDFLNSNITAQKYVTFLQKQQINKATFLGVNSLFGLLPFYYLAKQHDIEPIIGLTVSKVVYDKQVFTVTFFPHNFQGYQNLVQISSLVMTDSHLIFDLNVHLTLLKNLSLVIAVSNSNEQTDLLIFWKYLNKYSDHVYLGLTNSTTDWSFWHQQKYLNKLLPFFPVRHLNSEEDRIYQILQAIKNQSKCLFTKTKFQHFITFEDLEIRCSKIPSLLDNVHHFLSPINLILPEQFAMNLKKFVTPPKFPNNFAYLSFLCQQKLRQLHLVDAVPYQQRLNLELKVIANKQFIDYFLLVADYVNFAIKADILVGPGRGSAPGSLVAYLLGITKVDPIKYKLLFERFLNPARDETPPDIDIDFEDQKRNQILDYLFKKYGYKNVAQITTFQKIAFKLAIRDVGRALNIPSFEIDKIAKAIPLKWNNNFQEALKNKLSLRIYQKKYPDLFSFSEQVIGLPRHVSIHAAGLVISEHPIIETVPVWIDHNQKTVLQIEMHDLKRFGLIKMDLLGLRNLSIIATVLAKIGHFHQNKNHFFDQINLNDQLTFRTLQKGDTVGIFQLESTGMTQLLIDIKPSSIDDIALTISLYRPGAIVNKNLFLQRKRNYQLIEYFAPIFIPILQSTYGIPIFQEQIVQMITLFCRLSIGEGEIIRKAIAKKQDHLVQSIQQNFFQKAQQQNHPTPLIEKVWQVVFQFASYGFNRSHGVSYSFLVYWMSYLKTHHFAIFLLVLLNDVINDVDKTLVYLSLLRRQNIAVVPPTVKHPKLVYQIEGDQLFCPLNLIKQLSINSAKKIIIEHADNGPFANFFDFVARMTKMGLSRNELIILIDAGFFDQFGYNRATLTFNLNQHLLSAKYILIKENDRFVLDWNLLKTPPPMLLQNQDNRQLLRNEIAIYGFALTYQLIDTFINQQKTIIAEQKLSLSDLFTIQQKAFGKYSVVVLIEKLESAQTRSGKSISFCQVSDRTARLVKLIASGKVTLSKLTPGQIVCLQISISNRRVLKSYFLEYILI